MVRTLSAAKSASCCWVSPPRIRWNCRRVPNGPVRVPTQVLYGEDDAVIEPALAEQWARCVTGDLRVDRLPGGHFYTPESWAALPAHFDAPRKTPR
ncbi:MULTISPECIES: hypothetical protein [unclassified Streptomyces]|uniref:hypothetical protein n=1 Tax=unclassified Streptomyces TaxID=2593676 RepID=UPI001F5B94AE|nr:hypothetical protein [Streptomyces sp. HSG2]